MLSKLDGFLCNKFGFDYPDYQNIDYDKDNKYADYDENKDYCSFCGQLFFVDELKEEIGEILCSKCHKKWQWDE